MRTYKNISDNDMIKYMRYLKQACKQRYDCRECPMYDNCAGKDRKQPGLWYVPEVEI